MKRDDGLIIKRNTAIRKFYNSLKNVRELGVRKYTYKYCVKKTSEKFFLAPGTIERIVVGA